MTLASVAKQIEKVATDNSPAILTGVGVAGVAVTAVFTGKATVKAVRLHDGMMKERTRQLEATTPVGQELDLASIQPSRKDLVKDNWKLYIPAVGVASLTVTSIILANRIGTRRTAAMAALAAVTEKGWREYEEAVKNTVTKKANEDIRATVAQNKVNQVNSDGAFDNLVLAKDSEVIFVEGITGKAFTSTLNDVQKAANECNFEINHNMYVTLSQWLDKLGQRPTDISDRLGWDGMNMIELNTTGTIIEEGKYAGHAAIHIGYRNMPSAEFGSLH